MEVTMSQSRTNELEDYVRNIGRYLKNVDENISNIYSRISEINKKIKEIEDEIVAIKVESSKKTNDIINLKENNVQKTDFDEFVGRLTESLRELLPHEQIANEEARKEESA